MSRWSPASLCSATSSSPKNKDPSATLRPTERAAVRWQEVSLDSFLEKDINTNIWQWIQTCTEIQNEINLFFSLSERLELHFVHSLTGRTICSSIEQLQNLWKAYDNKNVCLGNQNLSISRVHALQLKYRLSFLKCLQERSNTTASSDRKDVTNADRDAELKISTRAGFLKLHWRNFWKKQEHKPDLTNKKWTS